MSFVSALDDSLQRRIGIPYLLATRDNSIHERLSYLVHILTEFTGPNPIRLLDVGCGSGMALRYLSRFLPHKISSYVGIDRDTKRLSDRYTYLGLEHAFHDVDLDDDWNVGEFDVVWCAEVIEHLFNDKRLFGAICRSVKPGGYVVVTAPSKLHFEMVGATMPSILEISPVQDGGHVRVGYTTDDLSNIREGTSAELVRVDAVTRCGETYHRARPNRGIGAVIDNIGNAIGRSRSDHYMISTDRAPDLQNYLSIAGIYRIR